MASNKINIVISAEDKASKPLRAVSDEMDHGSGKANKYNSALASMGATLGRTTLALGAAGVAATAASAAIGFKFNSSVEMAETKLMAFMKDGEKVAKTLAWVKEEAAATQFSFTDMADAAANLTPVAKTSGQSLESLVKQAEILAALNPTEGLTGATFSLREALSGDWVSIVDRFNLPRKRINELKEQGVPAMEIISRTLNEMGIDYSLVAKQGQTAAAQWDQTKDKLVMMAGAAAKPIFDRVKRTLGELNGFDYTSLGNNLAGIVSGAISAVDQFVPKVVEVGTQVGDYLTPKFQGLYHSLGENVLPILSVLWHDVLEPLIPVIGTLLVGALGLAVDALKFISDGIGWVVQGFKDADPVVLGLAGVFGTLAAAMAFNAIFNALSVGFATLTLVTIPGAMASVSALGALIASPIVMPAIAIGAALAAIATVWHEYNKMKAAIEQAKQAADADLATTRQMIAKNAQIQASGVYSQAKKDQWQKITNNAMASDKRLYGNATGTTYSPGGLTRVGEHGPEDVIMPRGAQVIPAYRSREQGTGSGSVIEQVIINNYTGENPRRIIEEIGFALELAS